MAGYRNLEAQSESALDLQDSGIYDEGEISAQELVAYLPLGQLLWAVIPAIATITFTYGYPGSHEQEFMITDTSLMHPLRHDTVPAFLTVFVYPLLMFSIFCCELVYHKQGRQSRKHALKTASLLSFGCLLTLVWVYVLYGLPNMVVGRCRPDFLDRCKPKPGLDGTRFYDQSICTNPDKFLISQGFASFPSGHSSFSAGFGAYACMYFFWCFFLRFPATMRRKNGGGQSAAVRECYTLLLMIPMTAPVLFAVYVAATRVTDNRHHPADVLAGLLAGTLGAILSMTSTVSHYRANVAAS